MTSMWDNLVYMDNKRNHIAFAEQNKDPVFTDTFLDWKVVISSVDINKYTNPNPIPGEKEISAYVVDIFFSDKKFLSVYADDSDGTDAGAMRFHNFLHEHATIQVDVNEPDVIDLVTKTISNVVASDNGIFIFAQVLKNYEKALKGQ